MQVFAKQDDKRSDVSVLLAFVLKFLGISVLR